jgi:DnaJ-class molecular chaperone
MKMATPEEIRKAFRKAARKYNPGDNLRRMFDSAYFVLR